MGVKDKNKLLVRLLAVGVAVIGAVVVGCATADNLGARYGDGYGPAPAPAPSAPC